MCPSILHICKISFTSNQHKQIVHATKQDREVKYSFEDSNVSQLGCLLDCKLPLSADAQRGAEKLHLIRARECAENK